eukprot:EG_transcript_30592
MFHPSPAFQLYFSTCIFYCRSRQYFCWFIKLVGKIIGATLAILLCTTADRFIVPSEFNRSLTARPPVRSPPSPTAKEGPDRPQRPHFKNMTPDHVLSDWCPG